MAQLLIHGGESGQTEGSHRVTRHLKGRELGVAEGEYEIHLATGAEHGGTAVVDEVGSVH